MDYAGSGCDGRDESETAAAVSSGALFLVRESKPRWGDTGGGTKPDPTLDEDALETLGDEIAVLAAQIHAATHEMLTRIAQFDRLGGWKRGGYRGCAEWLQLRTGMDPRTAREHVRCARALAHLPRMSASMARGELSFSKIRALTRFATAESEGDLLEYARMNTAAEVERLGRSWNELSRGDEADVERRRYRRRRFAIYPDEEGMYEIRGRLPAEVGVLLMRAVEAASDALFREGADWSPQGGARGPRTEEVTPEQRRADALGLIAERAMELGFGCGESAAGTEDGAETEGADAEGATEHGLNYVSRHRGSAEPRTRHPAPIRGTRAERYQVVIHVEPQVLSVGIGGSEAKASGHGGHLGDRPGGGRSAGPGDCAAARTGGGRGGCTGGCPGGRASGRSELEDGTRLTPATARRLACDASKVQVTRGRDGSVLDVGRRTRTVPSAILRALEIRDRGCAFPGCGLRFTEAHHVRHWADGGETKLSNLILLCRHHHRAVHEEGFTVQMERSGRPRFFDRTGWPLPDFAPPPPLSDDPVESLTRANRLRGVEPNSHTAAARYRRQADIPWELEAGAREALEGNALERDARGGDASGGDVSEGDASGLDAPGGTALEGKPEPGNDPPRSPHDPPRSPHDPAQSPEAPATGDSDDAGVTGVS